MNTKQLMWKYIIKRGYISDRSFYGVSVDSMNTEYWRDSLQEGSWFNLIDWNKTSEISDDSYSQFGGTFCDAGSINVLEGTLMSVGGEEFRWELELDGASVVSLIEDILSGG